MFLNQLFSLEGKVAVVVGGGGVLASHIQLGLARAGADIAILGPNRSNLDIRAAEVQAVGRRALPIQVDATSKADLETAQRKILADLGSVDILLNAAGINSATPFFDISEQEWAHILAVELGSVFLASQVFGRQMVDAGRGGSVINISSVSSGPPLSKVFTYSIAKGGVNQITQFLAREWAPQRVRVNAIVPGFFPAKQNRDLLTAERTQQILNHTPMARFGEPDELVAAAIFLASENASSFVTGSILRIDGGFGAMTI